MISTVCGRMTNPGTNLGNTGTVCGSMTNLGNTSGMITGQLGVLVGTDNRDS
jgi:hypothetical protein